MFSAAHRKDLPLFVGVAAAVLLSRIPFLGAGYGDNGDAWGTARAARDIALTHSYEASRLPGYPLPEISYSLIWQLGPFVLNGLTAALSAIGIAYFAITMRRIGCRDVILASLAVAFTPVVFISSTMSVDYVWALSFLLIAFYYVISERPIVAGAFLGLAIASRITSGAMLLPMSLLLVDRGNWRTSVRRVLRLTVAAGIIGAAAFVPVAWRYGSGFFTFVDYGAPTRLFAVLNATIWVWGAIGFACVALGFAAIIVQRFAPATTTSVSGVRPELLVVACWIGIGLYTIAFVRLPHEPAYLIPIVPVVVLLFGCLLDRRLFVGVCFGLLLSPFFLSITIPGYDDTRGVIGSSSSAVAIPIRSRPLTIDVLRGPILRDHDIRIESVRALDWILPTVRLLPMRSVVVAGSWYPLVRAALPLNDASLQRYVSSLDSSQAAEAINRGFRIYYLPGQRPNAVPSPGVYLKPS